MPMYPPPDDARPITLLIADDHPLILAGLAALIRAEPGLQLATGVNRLRDIESQHVLADEVRAENLGAVTKDAGGNLQRGSLLGRREQVTGGR